MAILKAWSKSLSREHDEISADQTLIIKLVKSQKLRKSHIFLSRISLELRKYWKYFKRYNLEVAHLPTRKLRSEICHLKVKKTLQEKAGVVYRIDCENCDASYVGETGRQVRNRMAEHENDIRMKKPASKVSEHVQQTGHRFKFNDVSILDNSNHRKTRLHLESIHTFKDTNAINRSLILNSTYQPLFSWFFYFISIVVCHCVYRHVILLTYNVDVFLKYCHGSYNTFFRRYSNR